MFNLSFLNSAILFGLIAGLIPVLIHLFIKHKPKIIHFGSLRFIKEIQQQKAKIIRLREIILLIIRILIILLIIFALSRPVVKKLFLSATSTSHAPTAVVLIIDNSFSMNFLTGNKTLLDLARECGIEIMDLLNRKDKVMLQTLSNPFNRTHSYFADCEQIKKDISQISITDNSQLFTKVIQKAEKELDRLDVINKEIYLITDNQNRPWKNPPVPIYRDSVLGAGGEEKQTTDIFIIPIRTREEKINIALQSAMYVPALLTKNSIPQVRAIIKNYSSKERETIIVSLQINNITEAEKVISLQPFQSKPVTFELNIKKEKIYFGSVNLKINYYLMTTVFISVFLKNKFQK